VDPNISEHLRTGIIFSYLRILHKNLMQPCVLVLVFHIFV